MTELEIAQMAVNSALEKLAPLFVDEAKLTFVMRVPGKPDAYLIATDDDLEAVAATVHRHMERSSTP